ncbi:protein piccolo [Trichonephila clavipes]|nr:protein piccolo [Trichonephila clavipes]
MTDVNHPIYKLSPPNWNVKPPEIPDFSSLNLGRARKPDYPEKPLINIPKISYPGLSELPDFSYLNTGRIQKPDFPSLTNYPKRTFANYPKLGSSPELNYPKRSETPSFSSFNRGWRDNSEKTLLNYPKVNSTPEFNYPKLPEMPNFNSRNRDSIRITSVRGSSNRSSGIRKGRGRGSSNRTGTFRSTNMTAGNYPRQPGTFQRPSGIPGANYPRQTYTSYPTNSLGSNVWSPQSGRAAPAYMNYGGLPTGANMYTNTEKKKGFIGSLMSMGTPKNKKNKYFGSQPSPYAVRNLEGGFLGKHGSKAAMYTILPYMAAKKTPKLFRPRFRPNSFHRHHYHYDHYGHSDHYDIYNNDYAGSCNRPIAPKNGEIVCHSTPAEVGCYVTCDKGYLLPSNTSTSNCWHVTGVWNPVKNFPDCKQAVCDKTCLNGGTCIGPDVCGCPPEYKGPRCEFCESYLSLLNISLNS